MTLLMQDRKPLIVNLFGGPGSGKSTTATGVFSKLKVAGVNAEYVSEYAKDLTWAGRSLKNQVLILGKQYDRFWRIGGQVEIIVTDSPLLLTYLYNEGHWSLSELAVDLHRDWESMNFLVKRVKVYNPSGRGQTEDEAKRLDVLTQTMLVKLGVEYIETTGNEEGIEQVYRAVLQRRGVSYGY